MSPTVGRRVSCSPRRVALVVGQLGIGGTEKQACLLAEGLPRWGFEPLVIALCGGEHEKALRDKGVRTVVLSRRRRFDLRRLVHTTAAIRAFRPVIVHGFDYAGSVYGKLAGLATRTPIMIGGLRCEYTPPARVLWSERALRPWTTAIISNSYAGKQAWSRLIGFAEQQIAVIHNGIDVDELARLPEGFRPLHELLNLHADTPLVGCVSSVYHLKNPLMFVRAAVKVRAANAAVHFVWIGDGPMRGDLEAAVREAGLENVFHITGRRSDAAWLAKDLCVGVLTSISEGLPNSIMEYLSWGIPAVVTDAGGCPELVEHGRSGFVVASDNAEAMAERIVELLANRDLAAEMGRCGRDRMRGEFSVARMVSQTVAVYTALLEKRTSAVAHIPAPARADRLIRTGR